jgi:valyl-tRNA synthetase
MIDHPLTGRQIPVIADEWADPELGTGVVKITPAHDFNDWQVHERHRKIGWINILKPDGTLNDAVPEPYRGLDRFVARKRIVADLDALGLLERVEDKVVQVPHGDRSGVPIEPYLTDQWYVDAAKLAIEARAAVADGRTRFVPATWEKTYFNWLDGIQPWCVSRQLWWGHRIPAWYTPEGTAIVARSRAEAQAKAGAGTPLTQDEDVLDTWFSSALWPFATLGWPEKSPDLARHYPGDVLVTAFDIIFFWVARMMMQGLHFTGEAPFHTVYCHGLVRDAQGRKMSKSLGNTVDPLTLIDTYGADAVRFTLAALESQGRDVKLDEKRIEGYRNFATKLWNAVRFAQSQGIAASAEGRQGIGAGPAEAPSPAHPVNRWILGEAARMVEAATAALESFRFDQYAETLYQFTWSRFCDWYLELAKPLLADGSADAPETRATAAFVLDTILKALHPAMPFLTEELWHAQGTRATDLILERWPEIAAEPSDAETEIAWLIDLITAIRSARTELNVPPAVRLPLHAGAALLPRLERHRAALERLARVSALSAETPAGGLLQVVTAGDTYYLPVGDVIDLAAERARLLKAAQAAEKEAASLASRLANPGFLERARLEAVVKARDDYAARSAEATRLRAALERLGDS